MFDCIGWLDLYQCLYAKNPFRKVRHKGAVASISEAKRFYDRVVKKFGLSLGVPVSEYVHSEGPHTAMLPYLKPSDLLRTLLSDYSFLLFGGCSEPHDDIEKLLLSFWRAYQVEHPEHEVFKNPGRLNRTFPITVHGDGGRTQKKQPLEIFSLQPVLGLNTASKSKRCRCSASVGFGGTDLGDPFAQHLNSKYSTFLTHFLIWAFPRKQYSNFDDILTGFLQEAMDDLGRACLEGVPSKSGTIFYPCCIGFKLDMEWMAKVGTLTRSYPNVGHVNAKACCAECDAGIVGVPFEDMNTTAAWIRTRFKTIPWQHAPPWSNVPFDLNKPAKFLRRDSFHIFRLGISRNFLASSIYLLIYMGCPLFSQAFLPCFHPQPC